MPLYCDGLCDAVICAPPSSPSLATAKYSMSVAIIPQSTTSAPCASAPSMKASASDGDDSRMSRDTAIRRRAEIGDKAAADLPRRGLVDLLRVERANVVRLEDVGIHRSPSPDVPWYVLYIRL